MEDSDDSDSPPKKRSRKKKKKNKNRDRWGKWTEEQRWSWQWRKGPETLIPSVSSSESPSPSPRREKKKSKKKKKKRYSVTGFLSHYLTSFFFPQWLTEKFVFQWNIRRRGRRKQVGDTKSVHHLCSALFVCSCYGIVQTVKKFHWKDTKVLLLVCHLNSCLVCYLLRITKLCVMVQLIWVNF